MRHGLCASLIATAILLPVDQGAHAAEAATDVYLLGSRGPNAGITPPPGVYFQDDTYFYSGKIGAGTTLATGGARRTAGFFTMAFPLMVDSGSEMAAGKAIKAKF